jgi:hypothetical protein
MGKLRYYKTEQHYQSNPNYEQCSIYLKHIFDIKNIEDSNKNCLEISTCKWYKANAENYNKEFYLNFESAESKEVWYIFLQYARTRAIHEDFLTSMPQNFGFISSRRSSPERMQIENIDRMNPPPSASRNPRESEKRSQMPSTRGSQKIKDYRNYQPDESFDRPGYGNERSKSPDFIDNRQLLKDLDNIPDSQNLFGNNSRSSVPRVNPEDEKKKKLVESFLNKSQLLFWSHVISVPSKPLLTNNRPLGDNTPFVARYPDLMRFENGLLGSPKKPQQQQQQPPPQVVRQQPPPRTVDLDVLKPRTYTFAKEPAVARSPPRESPKSWDDDHSHHEDHNEIPKKSGLPPSFHKPPEAQVYNPVKDPAKQFETFGGGKPPVFGRTDNPEAKNLKLPVEKGYELVNKEEVRKKDTKRNTDTSRKPIPEVNLYAIQHSSQALKKKKPRELDKPNIYGRFDFFPGFFMDSHFDDKVAHSYKNNIPKNLKKARRKTIDPKLKAFIGIWEQRGNNTFHFYDAADRKLGNRVNELERSKEHYRQDEKVIHHPMPEQLEPFNWSLNSPAMQRPNTGRGKADPLADSALNDTQDTSTLLPKVLNTSNNGQDSPPIRLRNTNNSMGGMNSNRKEPEKKAGNPDHSLISLNRVPKEASPPKNVQIPYPYRYEERNFESETKSQSDKMSRRSSDEQPNLGSIKKPSSNIPLQNYFFGKALRDTTSDDGNIFTVPRGEFVVVTRVYENKNFVECLWKGVIGVFPIADIQIVSTAKLTEDESGNIKFLKDDTDSVSDSGESLRSSSYASSQRYGSGFDQEGEPKREMYPSQNNYATFQQSNNVHSNQHDTSLKEDSVMSGYSQSSTSSKKPLKMLQRQQKRLEKSMAESRSESQSMADEYD